MSSRNSLEVFELAERIESEYDDKSILRGLELIEAGHELASILTSAIVEGRRGKQYWQQIEARIKSEPSLKSIEQATLRLPKNEVDEIIEKAKISDDELIEAVLAGGAPCTHVLPASREREIFTRLRELVSELGNSRKSVNALSYLLNFDTQKIRVTNLPTEQTFALALDWCFRFESSDCVDRVLSQLLRISKELPKDSSERRHIVEMGYRRLKCSRDEREIRFLLTGLMEADRSKLGRVKIAQWLKKHCRSIDRAHELDPLIINNWLHVTQCSRDSLARARRIIEKPMILDKIAMYSERKFVRRSLVRYLRRHLHRKDIQKRLSMILLTVRTKALLRLAKDALDLADGKTRYELIRRIAREVNDPKIVAIVKDRVLLFPDAPDSYRLVCAIAKTDPVFAAPWLAEWLKTAMPEQKSSGYALLLQIAPTFENAQFAYAWLREAYERDLPITRFEQTVLVRRLLLLNRNDFLEERARQLLKVRSNMIRECEYRKLEAALTVSQR